MPADRPKWPYALLGLAVVVFAFPLYMFIHWIVVSKTAPTFPEAVVRFKAALPEALQPAGRLEWTSAGACLVAAIVAGFALRALSSFVRGVFKVFIGVALLLGAWYLWTLM
jgi:hypothetical protein